VVALLYDKKGKTKLTNRKLSILIGNMFGYHSNNFVYLEIICFW
jgi:hypothetical protein